MPQLVSNEEGNDGQQASPRRLGLVQVYTGKGKGKTTAALGLAVRAAGHGMRTYICQFMKGGHYGELDALRDHPYITIEQQGTTDLLSRDRAAGKDVGLAQAGLEIALTVMQSGTYDVIVLDEVNLAVAFGLIDLDDVLSFIDQRPPQVELILTGRNAPASLIERADLVTEMTEVKHYFRRGVLARPGIEC